MIKTNDFIERIRILQELLNEAIEPEAEDFTIEKICEIANIPDAQRVLDNMNNVRPSSYDVPMIWIEQLSDTFGVNREWLESGVGNYPFKSNLGRRFIPFDAMEILRWEYLSDIEEFIIAFGRTEGSLQALIIRHKNGYCYEIYPHMYPFFSGVGESGKNEILEFYRFLKFARRIGKLCTKAYFLEDDSIIYYYMGEVAPLKIKTETATEYFLDEILNLSDNIDLVQLSDDSLLDIFKIFTFIRNDIDRLAEINDEYDWDIILRKNPYLADSEQKRFEVYVKEVERSDDQLTGIETDALDNDESEEEPYDVNSIIINTKSVTAFQVEHWINTDMLDLSPEYQRNLVWDRNRKSALIESMMLNIPIPAFYLDEREDGVKTVVDGLQRLSTIHGFFSGEFTLSSLQYLHMYNDMGYNQLNSKYRSRLEDTQLTMNILDARCPEDAKFDVFRRVNTGGMPLNAQEVRNALSTRQTRKLLQSMSEDSAFKKATLSRINDVRMGAQELCLRYICISDHFDWEAMTLLRFKGLKKTMDAMVICLNKEDESENERRLKEFHLVMEQSAVVLGKKSFSRKEEPFKINKSLLTAWAVCLKNLHLDNTVISNNAIAIRGGYSKLLENDLEFQDALSRSTTQRKSIEYTIMCIRKVIEGNV